MRQTLDRELLNHGEVPLQCEEWQMPLWRAGEVVPAGTYVRVDDQSYRAVCYLIRRGHCLQRLMGTSRCIAPGAMRAGIVQIESRLFIESIEKKTPGHPGFRLDVKQVYPLSNQPARPGRLHVLRDVHLRNMWLDKRHRSHLTCHVCAVSVEKEVPYGSSSSDALQDTSAGISRHHACAHFHERFSCVASINACHAFHTQFIFPDALSLLLSSG